MLDFIVAGVPAGLVVVAIVEAVKRIFKIDGDKAILVAILAGVIVALASQAGNVWPAFAMWWQTVIAGVLLGLGACGLFDISQAVKSKL